MRLIDALIQYPTTPIFGRIEGLESDTDDKRDWEVEPIDAQVLKESEVSQFYIIKAMNVLPNGKVNECYMDVYLPERVSDYAYFLRGDSLDIRYHHEFEGEIICAVPIDCFGVYDLFYSKNSPDIGIDILKQGLAVSIRKHYIAEDLGYILRDERRFKEAAEMFQIAADEKPSSNFIYGELAGCYKEIGQLDKAQIYYELFDKFQ